MPVLQNIDGIHGRTDVRARPCRASWAPVVFHADWLTAAVDGVATAERIADHLIADIVAWAAVAGGGGGVLTAVAIHAELIATAAVTTVAAVERVGPDVDAGETAVAGGALVVRTPPVGTRPAIADLVRAA